MPVDSGVHVVPGAGDTAGLGDGLAVQFKVVGHQTGGSLAVVEHPIEPRVIVDPHRHEREDELSYVLQGTVCARVGDTEIEATPGSYVWKPRGVPHTLWNPGPRPARIIEFITPAGLERCFEEFALLLVRSPAPSEEELYAVCDRYGLTFDRTWLPDIEARFGRMRIV